jgi:hypothetical protein
MEDAPMRKITLAAITVAVAAGAASIYAASNSSGGRLISGSGPITEQQIRDKLTADGFSNIQITLKGSVFETVATKDGAPGRTGNRCAVGNCPAGGRR